MEKLSGKLGKKLKNYVIDKSIIEFLIVAVVIIFLTFHVALRNYMLFHTVVETFGVIITSCIFIIAINTYHINKNSFLLIIGIGYGFDGLFYMLHNLTLLNIGFYTNSLVNLSSLFALYARFFGTSFTLIATVVLYRGNKKVNPKACLLGATIVAIILLHGANYQEKLPAIFIEGHGYTNFNIICVALLDIAICVCFILFSMMEDKIESKLYCYIQWAIIIKLVSDFMLAGFSNEYSMENVVSHVLKIIYYYFIYKAIVEKSIKEPYRLLYGKLDETSASLEITTSELRETNDIIEKDNAYINEIEEILNSSEQCYKLIIENSRDAIFAESNGKFIFYNEGARNIVGLNNKYDIYGSSIKDFIVDEEKGNFEKKLRCIYEEKITVPFSQTIIKKADGSKIDVEVSGTFFLHRGEPAILTIVRDITQVEELKKDAVENTKLLNESREYNKLVNEFFVNISHEVRTPLNVILGAIQVLEVYSSNGEGIVNEEKFNDYLKSIKQNCFRLLRLINNLIDVSKLGSGFLQTNMKNGDIICTVEDIVQSVAEYINAKGVALVFDTEVEEKIMAFDADKIERIMLNLLSNSIKFTRPGDDISVFIIDKGGSISISVKDTGIGIPEEKINSIFDRFVQVDKSLTRNQEGSGIGLSLVKSLVELHGGTIDVSSTMGEGTEFVINLPVKIIEDENSPSEEIISHTNVERISIEFSDIYTYN
ncbi:sensor histidine kinase [Clostridium omnivorum]|uniref:histidine kinase n=1 Tax=Clostridium omnivorum TaxID=1604902 RepID=A0ABQ5N685_9CLOT|nr:MASE3 domain-containing protein [Clostridium sp. E14]GLC30743.1 hypothetical protein bsdE14_21530 [Clostridium sp. E14]